MCAQSIFQARRGSHWILCLSVLLGPWTAWSSDSGTSREPDSLSLEDALARTRNGNPELAARRLEIDARSARLLQAVTRPNPQIGVDAENFAGSGAHSGVDALETTIRLDQEFELGGKRAARKKLAGSEKDLAGWDFNALRLELEYGVRSAFTDVLAAQERIRILEGGLAVNQQIQQTAQLRHKAGKAPATEEMKARMANSLHHIELDRATQELDAARIRLNAFWSNAKPAFSGVRGDLKIVPATPSLDSLLPRLQTHPDLARWKSESDQRRFAAEVARAERIPNLSVGGGVRQLNDAGKGDVALVAGVSMPLPLFNRNLGNIREAGHRIAQADKEREAAMARLSSRLRALHAGLSSRSEEIAHLKDELLPDADKTLQASREAYQLGKLSFLEVLDSQRTLYELSTRYLSTLAEYHKEWNELQSMVTSGEPGNP